MGFMDWIGPALTPITQGVAGYQQGVAQKQKRQQDEQLQMIELLRERQQDADRAAELAIRKTESEGAQALRALQTKEAEYNLGRPGRERATLQRIDPNNPLLQGTGGDFEYGGELTTARQHIEDLKKRNETERNAERLLRLHYPKSALLQTPYDPTNPAPYAAELERLQHSEDMAIMHRPPVEHEAWQMTSITDADGNPLMINARTGATKPITGGGKLGGTGGVSSSGRIGASSQDMGAALKNFDTNLQSLQKKNVSPSPLMQHRMQLDINPLMTGKPASFKDMLAGGTLDVLGYGAGAKGWQDYAALMQASRQFGEEATRLFGNRAGFQQMKLMIQEAQLTPQDFNNPTVITQKRQRMQILYEQARLAEQRAGIDPDKRVTPTGLAGLRAAPTLPVTSATPATGYSPDNPFAKQP